ncbi:lipase [Abortiporus biennis]|nr:lipase [Abortiporus biennis]
MVSFKFIRFVLLAATLCAVSAAPAPAAKSDSELVARQSITALSTSQISSFKPFTLYASTGYCNPSTTINWSCGSNCQANPTFKPVASGGDGDDVQFWFVGFDPTLKTVIVSHQGTDTSQIEPILTDGDIITETLDSTLFPGISSDIEVHSGFTKAQSLAANDVLAAVKTAISSFKATQVTIVGHSLGGAIALLDSVFLPLHISGVSFKTVTYGMPRVGNQAFANYVDAHVTSLTHINNKEDFVPILPGRFLGFHHPSGEVHIMDNNQWVSCPGQDNTSAECTVGDVPNIFDGTESDHDGPYDGIAMGC